MKYYKYVGNLWDAFYAVDRESSVVKVIEIRYIQGDSREIETILSCQYRPEWGTLDTVAVNCIETYEASSTKEWAAAKTTMTNWIKKEL